MRNLLKFLLFFCLPILVSAQNFYRDLGKVDWNFRKRNDSTWYHAVIPGTVHTDLHRNKIIPDPFFGSNEKKIQWIENEDWEYETSFSLNQSDLTSDNCELQFDGLDTYAHVYLNGKLVLRADNMFRNWSVNVKNNLKVGTNELKVVFESAVKKGKLEAEKLQYTLPGDEKVFTRKAQYQYGWDWGPRFVTAGIWKKVQLYFWNNVKFENLTYDQLSLSDSKSELLFKVDVLCHKPGKYKLKVNGLSEEFILQKGKNRLELKYEILNPKRWWTNGLGAQNLYAFDVQISEGLQIEDHKKLQIGLRTLELVQEKDSFGKSFYFKLNGVPVFMKGANYIPPNSFMPNANDSTYIRDVRNAVEANMNMLRVWGGGVYADDVFYEECDKNGILVWQDFMFACAMYPGDEYFLDNIKHEVIDNVNRIQNHASIAIWCGNNENDEGWHNWGWQKQYKYSQKDSTEIWNNYKKLFHDLIPKTLDSLLSKNKNRYWPSSPSIGWGRKESLTQGDSHYWGVWWGMEPFDVYKNKVGRFMSEYGFQGMPDKSTFNSIVDSKDLHFESEAVKNHQKHPIGYQTIDTYMKRGYKIPKNFENYIYVSQLLQAEGIKTAIEAHRRSKPKCMGTLYWQLNDCWPVTSWSSVDYFGRWKALHYQVKRSYDEVLLSVDSSEKSSSVYVVNDRLLGQKGKLQMKLMDFHGKILWETQKEVDIQPNSSAVFSELNWSDWGKFNPKKTFLNVTLGLPNEEVKSVNHFFVVPKKLKLRPSKISVKKLDQNTIEVTSDVLAKNVFLSSDNGHFSDNYFDLLPNEKKIIDINGDSKNIRVISLNP